MILNILCFIFGFITGFLTFYLVMFYIMKRKMKELSKIAFLNLNKMLKELEKFKKYNNK